MKQICIENPIVATQLYVDDTALLAAGEKEEAHVVMEKAVKDYVKLSKKLGLKLSTKGVIIAKLPYAAKMIVEELKTIGVIYNVVESTRDLGVDFSFSKKPAVRKSILKNRIKKARGTLNKIYRIAQISRRARVLFSGAGFSKSTWGHQTSALSYAEWSQIEVAAANAAGFKAGRCRYSAPCVAYGPEGHPFARGLKEIFILWFKILMPLINKQHIILEKLDESCSKIYIELTSTEGQGKKKPIILRPQEMYQLELWQPCLELPNNEITLEKSLTKADGIAAHVNVMLYGLGWTPISHRK